MVGIRLVRIVNLVVANSHPLGHVTGIARLGVVPGRAKVAGRLTMIELVAPIQHAGVPPCAALHGCMSFRSAAYPIHHSRRTLDRRLYHLAVVTH